MKSLTAFGCIVLLVSGLTGIAQAAGPGVKLGHDQVQKLTTGYLTEHMQYAPKLYIEHGCKPYTAVDDAGNYSGGLRARGRHDGGCNTDGFGQAYVRSVCKDAFCAYMYVYYMPKDNGFPFAFFGHRHDFEEIVVWTKNGNFIGAAYSAHGDYNYHTSPYMSGGRVNASYAVDGVTHSMATINNKDRDRGQVWPIASWDLMTAEAKQALNDSSNFPSSVFAAKDENFIAKVNEARLSSVDVTF